MNYQATKEQLMSNIANRSSRCMKKVWYTIEAFTVEFKLDGNFFLN